MGRLFLQLNMSLDGYINDSTGEIDWHFADEEFQGYIDETLEAIGGMVFGRVAFEELAGFWPSAGDEVSPVQARLMHELPKHVLSHSPVESDWNNSHWLGEDPAAALSELKRGDGGDIALFAGGEAATAALEMGVVDEVRVILNPALLGGGTRLFDGRYPRTELRLARSRELGSGALIHAYEPVSVVQS
jgi:dihydrofolate reductase